MTEKINRIVLAFSGGLDTSVILKWLQQTYGCEVVTFTADLGQGEELEPARAKAQLMGVKQEHIFIDDLREEFVKDYVFPMMRSNALYEGLYLLGTSIARPLIAKRQIDFIRVHISQIGGLSPARKMAAMCEFFGVRTAWHGPGDVSPVGHAANVHLDLAVPNFGIQEAHGFCQAEIDCFPGCPELRDGYFHANDQPGLGIDIDETLAARFPASDDPPFDLFWGNIRNPDGTIQKP